MYFGTHRFPQSLAMASLTLVTSSGLNSLPGFISRNKMTLSSMSCGRR